MAAELPPTFTVLDAMVSCGIPNDGAQFEGQTPAQRIAEQVFMNTFESCIDKTKDELSDDLSLKGRCCQFSVELRTSLTQSLVFTFFTKRAS